MLGNRDDSVGALKSRIGVLKCQKISLESEVAHLRVENGRLVRSLRELEGKLAAAGFEFVDRQSEMEREMMAVYRTMGMIDLALGACDENQLRGMKAGPFTAYEQGFVDICQAVDSCEFYQIYRAAALEREGHGYGVRLDE